MDKTILVTGGTGYIGSHTTVELQQSGYKVIIIDNLSNSNIHVLDGIEKITGVKPEFCQFDLCDRTAYFKFLELHKNIAGIIHFAACKAVGESVQLPLKYYRNNLVSLMNILEGMSEYGILNLVFSSSCTVYGQPDQLPVTEDSPVKPAESPYGNTKQISEEMIQDTVFSNKTFKAIALRYFNPIGAHPSACIGELPIGVPSNLVPYVTQTAAGLLPQLNVFGSDYNTPDGSAIRDYIHVEDIARAHIVALERMIRNHGNSGFEIFNLGTGQGSSVLEVIHAFEKATGVKLNYVLTDRRAGDIEKVWANTSKANEVLGWKSEKSLEETLLSAWNWQKALMNMKA